MGYYTWEKGDQPFSDIVKRSLSELVVAAPVSNILVDLGEERIA
jgi:hypothetical protein